MDMSYLNQSLKNLEYISQFEHYLSCREDSDFSSEFLQSFNQLKIDAQLATLNSTNAIMKKVKTAA
ncbi:hypothetical protein BTO05_11220 [Winogradskyella sp. PC-19]|nr:hypothetical protein BTO05_11220 [Winogradskyella sp. PC-19]